MTIGDELLKEVMAESGAKTKKGAIVTAMRDYLRFKIASGTQRADRKL